jgi:hypothetical protein
MALALNVFKTITKIATGTPVGIYTAPVGYSGVVLLAQVANIDSVSHDVTVSHQRMINGSPIVTEIVKDLAIQGNDTANILNGKLVLETGDSLVLSGSDDTNLKFIGSILETLN